MCEDLGYIRMLISRMFEDLLTGEENNEKCL